MKSTERYIPDRETFLAAYRSGAPVGAIIFHDDYYRRETAEWLLDSFDDAAELFDALQGPGNTDLPHYHRITLEQHQRHTGGFTVNTITRVATR